MNKEKKFLEILKLEDKEIKNLALRGLYDVILRDWIFDPENNKMNDDKSFRIEVAGIWFDLYPDGKIN